MQNVQKHPNYYQKLLLQGAKIVSPLTMIPGAIKGKGRIWEVKAVLLVKGGITVYLSASFHGGLAETTEVAAANMNISKIVTRINSQTVELRRESYGLIMLDAGVYTTDTKLSAEDAKLVRNLCNYNTNLFIGVPSEAELTILYEIGYRPIIVWEKL